MALVPSDIDECHCLLLHGPRKLLLDGVYIKPAWPSLAPRGHESGERCGVLGVLLQPSPEFGTECVGESRCFVVVRVLVAVGAEVVGQFRGSGHGHVYPEFEARDALRYGHDRGLAVRYVPPYTNLNAETERCYDPHYASYRQ